MKKINLAAIFCSLSLFSGLIYAEVPLKSNADVEGNWKLEYTKKSETSTENMKREDNWNFKAGKVTITHIPREGTYYDQTPISYEIEDGKLKIALLGRPDKFDIFTLHEKTEKNMTLKGKFGDLYFFVKK